MASRREILPVPENSGQRKWRAGQDKTANTYIIEIAVLFVHLLETSPLDTQLRLRSQACAHPR
jgi:hypothetical protein